MGTKEIANDVLVGVIVYAITTALALLLGNAANLFSHIERIVLLQLAALFTSPVILSAIVIIVVRRRKSVKGLNYPRFPVSIGRPDQEYGTYRVTHFGVDWVVIVGTNGGPAYGYSLGPFCPDDDYELDRRYEPTLFGSKKSYWHCAICGKKFRRSETDYGREDEVIEKVAVARWHKESEEKEERH